MTRVHPRHGQRDEGFAATELVLGVGLLLVPVALLVLTLPTWSERQTTARAMARAIARLVAAQGSCDTADAVGLGQVMARNLGLPDGDAQVRVGCTPGAPLAPGSEVQADVTVVMPAVHLLGIGDVGAWRWTASHRQPVDLYVSDR